MKTSKQHEKKIVWFVASLQQRGGGERFVLETVRALRKSGLKTSLICDRLSDEASFDGTYDLSDVVDLEQSGVSEKYFLRLLQKCLGIFSLYAAVRRERPTLIICQSEHDAIKISIISKLLNCRYRVFIFGQMFQFKTDISKYSRVFREHLEIITASSPGYGRNVTLPPPRLKLTLKVLNEILSYCKYQSIRAADKIFVVSNQVRWEVSLLYKREASVARAAISTELIDRERLLAPKRVSETPRILSVCRLVDKKRVDLIIEAFSLSGISGTLRIVGTGHAADRLKDLTENCDSVGEVQFLGALSDQEIVQELDEADCFVSMDIGDFDISVVEAMAKGLRVIVATDFDLDSFPRDISGVVAVVPLVETLACVFRHLDQISSPGPNNIGALEELTWDSLAAKCVAETEFSSEIRVLV